MNTQKTLQQLLNDPELQLNEEIQSLWSGYGQVVRVFSPKLQRHLVVKVIGTARPLSHPRGWNSSIGHERKVRSYEVEFEFYGHYAPLTSTDCKVPALIASGEIDGGKLLVMEDLDEAGYFVRKEQANWQSLSLAVKWLANFHALFLGSSADGLWPIGTYWHLGTRHQEWLKMTDGPLKQSAAAIDQALNNAEFQTLVHGDAKFQNLCFHHEAKTVAAVDFQYIGRGVGVKDLVCLLSGCLTDEDLQQLCEPALNLYLETLINKLKQTHPQLDWLKLEKEYRDLFPVAWADLYRFLLGWNPESFKVTEFMKQQTQLALLRF